MSTKQVAWLFALGLIFVLFGQGVPVYLFVFGMIVGSVLTFVTMHK